MIWTLKNIPQPELNRFAQTVLAHMVFQLLLALAYKVLNLVGLLHPALQLLYLAAELSKSSFAFELSFRCSFLRSLSSFCCMRCSSLTACLSTASVSEVYFLLIKLSDLSEMTFTTGMESMPDFCAFGALGKKRHMVTMHTIIRTGKRLTG